MPSPIYTTPTLSSRTSLRQRGRLQKVRSAPLTATLDSSVATSSTRLSTTTSCITCSRKSPSTKLRRQREPSCRCWGLFIARRSSGLSSGRFTLLIACAIQRPTLTVLEWSSGSCQSSEARVGKTQKVEAGKPGYRSISESSVRSLLVRSCLELLLLLEGTFGFRTFAKGV